MVVMTDTVNARLLVNLAIEAEKHAIITRTDIEGSTRLQVTKRENSPFAYSGAASDPANNIWFNMIDGKLSGVYATTGDRFLQQIGNVVFDFI